MDLESHDRLIDRLKRAGAPFVLDGAVVRERFANANRRILWILKEPDGGGDWDLRDFLNTGVDSYPDWWRTFALVAKASHGVLQGMPQWGSWAEGTPAIKDALRDIAVINVNKRGGGTRADWKKLSAAAREFDETIAEQIELLDPNIVILGLGGSLSLLPSTVQRALADLEGKPILTGTRIGQCVWFNGYHPNQSTITHEAYYTALCGELTRLMPLVCAPQTQELDR